MSTVTTEAAPRPDVSATPTGSLRWTVWPLRDRFAAVWWAPAAVIATGLLVATRLGSTPAGLVAAVAVAVTLAPYCVPVTYVVGRDALEIQCLGRRRLIGWTHVRAVRSRPRGATVFAQSMSRSGRKRWSSVRVTFPAPSDAYRGELRRRVDAARRTPAA